VKKAFGAIAKSEMPRTMTTKASAPTHLLEPQARDALVQLTANLKVYFSPLLSQIENYGYTLQHVYKQ
jgi:hypothetical protein